MNYKLLDSKHAKMAVSPQYNYVFSKRTGYFERWGIDKNDEPTRSPMPEIVDIEISQICSGDCTWCYKSNMTDGKNMTLETFKQVLDLFVPFVTQVALGIGDAGTNPDLVPIMEYCRAVGVIPNLTLTGIGLTPELGKQLSELAGAISVSVYPHTYRLAYATLRSLQKYGLGQVNFHLMVSNETLGFIYGILNDVVDYDWVSPNAVVLLALKQKGRGRGHTSLNMEQFEDLVNFCFEHDISFGCDSCSAGPLLEIVGEDSEFKEYIEPCESGLFSYYVDVDGVGYPCSFTEGEWAGIDLLNVKDFSKEVWNSPSIENWRDCLLCNDRNCPVYNIYGGVKC